MLTSYCLASPQLNWGEDGAPHSTQFDDVYFDKNAGLEETRYVFLQHNNLSERWKKLTTDPASNAHFTIAETGFGTGLNFLCAWQAFIEDAPTNASLHFISVEKFPLDKAALENALKMWPSLQPYSQALIAHYPELSHGLHRLELAQGRIQLTLWFGEAEEGFAALNADVDAWFLDGFAPSKNPEMWSPSLFQHIHRLSHQGTSFATFTAAGIVRRGLQEVGFEVRKVKGFGHKREMAIGELTQQSQSFSERMSQGKAWFNVRPNKTAESPSTTPEVLVVGAGLAGATTAFALAQQGVKVTVWEQGDSIACKASGNPQGMLYPKLASQDTPINRFYLSAYLYASRLYSQLDDQAVFWQQCGLEQRPTNAKEQQRFTQLLNNKLYPESIVRQYDDSGSLFLPLSGWVVLTELCQKLLNHPQIKVSLRTRLSALEKVKQGPHRWLASHQSQQQHFSHVVICTANDTHDLDFLPSTPAYPIRGQVSYLPLDAAQQACTSKNQPLAKLSPTHVLCQAGYVSPPLKDTLHFGATYDIRDSDESVRAESQQRNLRILEELLHLPKETLPEEQCGGRVSFRCAIPDYAPMVGPIASPSELQSHYARLSKNAKWQSHQTHVDQEGLFINIGHGSRGLVSTPLTGHYLANLITNTPSPLEQSIMDKLHPNRFAIRAIKRNEQL
ncbi:bifunctional tRNA (5-methylaminomethyl-2-thiouridine)(34)-methyltransferase MnmD/FAD-dependent 5-carboxymethylaminomethyl-2-thiouridine(34) oxidoreductase MnmC [Marinomonas pollencensis]|uniref:tRNA 5-methylaminomethyl-2-thiouridine biosynthesis bifunctional protein MnmC n=1 Tax=Marinomonas pollencensis TaxID=491954 RepID=A0A3E0DLK7_9GAMM|nr:bifunctional tRNA (5-methylaminomethyl-2-thiouridine)(34)-methyltransferase MnmD/FAD-dependent 5-carboxymethylaminomethyl-2-thiouridine(34) oxidoreductase MnmC [Marinomonas pollencensis]REG82974.1 tRNA 5-methylaminomethyl-2-thiouridine biosynthesis bifunctional protein [Marinomonas pollencensis]